MNKLLLNMVMLLQGVWRSMGADVDQLRAILQVRLMLDDRKPVALGRSARQKKDRKYGSALNFFVSLVMGVVYMLPLITIADGLLGLTVYFSLLISIISLMLITDFSSVLFDARDKFILFPRPVNDKTIVLARMLHVFIYLFRIVLPMSLPGWVVLGVVHGWQAALIFPLPLVLMVFLVLFIVNSVYLLVLRIAKPEKFKDVINYFQIATSVVFFASVYLFPRLLESQSFINVNIQDHPMLRLAPSYWLAACWAWVGFDVYLGGTYALSVLAIVLPVLCMYAVVRWLSPQFSRRIAGIDNVEVAEYKPAARAKRSSGRFYQWLAQVLNRTDEARAGFMIAWLQTSRSRSFRMRVFPSFAFVPVYFIFIITKDGESFSDSLARVGNKPSHLILLYYSSFVMVSVLNYLYISEQYKASWVYYASPVEVPGRIMSGALKAVLVKFYVPFVAVLSLFVVYIWGVPAIMDVVLALVNVSLFVACMARIGRQLPFSTAEQMKQGGSRVVKSLLVMTIPLGLGFGHYFARNLWWLECIFLGLSAMALWLVWDSYSRVSWEKVMRTAEEG